MKKMYHALIVTPNATTRNEITNTIKGLGHKPHLCGDIQKAIEILDHKAFAYTIVDFNIDDENCYNLKQVLKFIDDAYYSEIPSIVVTGMKTVIQGYGFKFIREGAFDVIDYPFPSKGRSLHDSIKDMLNLNYAKDKIGQPFTGGMLTFFKDEIRLLGALIARMEDIGMTVDFLKLLAVQTKSGKRKIYSVKRLMKLLNATSPQAIIAMVNRLRLKIAVCLKEEQNIIVDQDEIIKHKKGKYGGYYLSYKVELGPSFHKLISVSHPNVHKRLPPNATKIKRKDKIIMHIEKYGSITRKLAAEICNCSARTSLRDLEALAAEGIVEFTGHSSLGVWRFTKKYKQESSIE